MVFSGDSFSACLKMCVDKLNDQSNIENLLSLLMIFNFLAEANADRQIVIDETSKSIFTQNLDNIEIDVLTYINFIIKKIIFHNEKYIEIVKDKKTGEIFRVTFKDSDKDALYNSLLQRLYSNKNDLNQFANLTDNNGKR